MKYLFTLTSIIALSSVSCKKSTSHDTTPTPKEDKVSNIEPKEKPTDEPLFFGSFTPTPQHEKIESSEIGSTLDDAVRVLGPWDQVGDISGDEKGSFYPFSNRNGYHYLVRIGKNSSINGVWRRPQKQIQQATADQPSPKDKLPSMLKMRIDQMSIMQNPNGRIKLSDSWPDEASGLFQGIRKEVEIEILTKQNHLDAIATIPKHLMKDRVIGTTIETNDWFYTSIEHESWEEQKASWFSVIASSKKSKVLCFSYSW